MRVDRAACEHSWETTDPCGLAVRCVLCKKTLGNLRHREHKHRWTPGGAHDQLSIGAIPKLVHGECETFGCTNAGYNYFVHIGHGTWWLCRECMIIQANIK